MPGLSGSQKAYKQARSGIARAAASRAGYFTPNLIVLINGIDRTSKIDRHTVRYVQTRSIDVPDQASFTLNMNAGFTPTEDQTVVIALGASNNREFAGQILTKTHRRNPANQFPFIDIDCIDTSRLFNRRLVTAEYFSLSATLIAIDIIDTYTSGFTRLNVAPDLPTIDDFPVTNETPTSALRRLANLINGGCYLDPYSDVHLYGSGGEPAARVPSSPLTLTNTLSTLRIFVRHKLDASQKRNRIIVEGARTTLVCAVPNGVSTMPVTDASEFIAAMGSIVFVRIGQEVLPSNDLVAGLSPFQPAVTAEFRTVNDANAVLFADASVGATSVQLTQPTTFGAGLNLTHWAQIGAQIIYFTAYAAGSGGANGSLTGIPASGFGSIQTDLKAGMIVKILDSIHHFNAAGAVTKYSHRAGVEVVLRVLLEDTAAQSTLAASEGGDGVHEEIVSDGRLTQLGAIAIGNARLGSYKNSLTEAEWITADMNARAGRSQVINLSGADPLSITLPITRSETTFLAPNFVPERHCTAAPVLTTGSVEILQALQSLPVTGH